MVGIGRVMIVSWAFGDGMIAAWLAMFDGVAFQSVWVLLMDQGRVYMVFLSKQ